MIRKLCTVGCILAFVLLSAALSGCKHICGERRPEISSIIVPPIVPSEPPTSLIVDWSPRTAAHLGGGFDAVAESQVKDSPLIYDGVELADSGARELHMSIQAVQTYSELYQALNLSIRAEVDAFMIAGGSASVDFAASKTIKDEDVILVIKGVCDYGRATLKNPRLSPTAKHDAGDPVLFKQRYGTHVVLMESRFSEVGAVITIHTHSKQDALTLKTDMSGSFDLGVVGGSMEQHLSLQSKSILEQSKFDVDFYARGGEGLSSLSGLIGAFAHLTGKTDWKDVMHGAVEGISSYVAKMSQKNSPAVRYYCLPLDYYVRSLELDKNLSLAREAQVVIAEGLLKRRQLANFTDTPFAYTNKAGVPTNTTTPSDALRLAQARASLDLAFLRKFYKPTQGRWSLPLDQLQIEGAKLANLAESPAAREVARRYSVLTTEGKATEKTFSQGALGNPYFRWRNWLNWRQFDQWQVICTEGDFQADDLSFDEANKLGKDHEVLKQGHRWQMNSSVDSEVNKTLLERWAPDRQQNKQ